MPIFPAFQAPGAAAMDEFQQALLRREMQKRQDMLDSLQQQAADQRTRAAEDTHNLSVADLQKANAPAAPVTHTLSEGQRVIDADGNVIAEYAKPEKPAEGFTLSPGQQRFNANGSPVASSPAAPAENEVTLNGDRYRKDESGNYQKVISGYREPVTPAAGPQPQIFVGNDGKPRAVVFSNGQAHEVALPADVVAKSGTPAPNIDPVEAQKRLGDIDQLTQALATNDKGLSHFGSGIMDRAGRSFNQDYTDYKSQLDRLKATMTLDKLKQNFGGRVTNRDLELMANSVAAINENMSPAAVKTELNRIRTRVGLQPVDGRQDLGAGFGPGGK